MFDHVAVVVSDLEKSKAFYTQALAPIGHSNVVALRVDGGDRPSAGFCHEDGSDFWISQGEPTRPLHVAFRASSRAAVDAFHAAALAAGGRDNGKPGLRPQYHPNYYGAYVWDPDGHNIEAVCHDTHATSDTHDTHDTHVTTGSS
jgi:catechol 2,3-dioxygenase-like lactoylglutathione lyase family enzyme